VNTKRAEPNKDVPGAAFFLLLRNERKLRRVGGSVGLCMCRMTKD
jgi:hypothetical protein